MPALVANSRFLPPQHGQVYMMTVARGQATPGSQLLNLRYRNEWTAGSRAAKVRGCGCARNGNFGLAALYCLQLPPVMWSQSCCGCL